MQLRRNEVMLNMGTMFLHPWPSMIAWVRMQRPSSNHWSVLRHHMRREQFDKMDLMRKAPSAQYLASPSPISRVHHPPAQPPPISSRQT